MSRIYTRHGDRGETGLLGGSRVRKSAPRVQACGTVDELNSALGLAIAHCTAPGLTNRLAQLQPDLFAIGAHLATPPAEAERHRSSLPPLPAGRIPEMERWIDEWDSGLPPLRRFIMPGGGFAGAALHLARAVCRRAERETVELSEHEPVPDVVLRFLNRLSDLLFVAARLANYSAGQSELQWLPELDADDAPLPGSALTAGPAA